MAGPTRRSTRNRSKTKSNEEEEKKEEVDIEKSPRISKKKKLSASEKKKEEDSTSEPAAKKQKTSKSTSTPKKTNKAAKTTVKKAQTNRDKEQQKEEDPSSSSSSKDNNKPATKKPKKAATHQIITERDALPKLWNPTSNDNNDCFKVISWNVAGIRALQRNHPNALSDLAKSHNYPNVICLQETKLQETHVSDPKLELDGHVLKKEGYDAFWSCSTTKKGYSGTAVFVRNVDGRYDIKADATSNDNDNVTTEENDTKKNKKKKQATLFGFVKKTTTDSKEKVDNNSDGDKDNVKIKTTTATDEENKNMVPVKVSYGLGKRSHDEEGRIITVDFPLFSLTNLYVPNSGQKLERLTYRTDSWDRDLVETMQAKEQKDDKPVIWLGDLNVAHTNLDACNDGAKHLAKTSGTTPEERESFTQQLASGYVDIFRQLHPTAKGHYTYWSQRVGNRAPNKGLRLDYFVGSKALVGDGSDDDDKKVVVKDCYMLPDQVGSDHCPVVLELQVKK